LIFCLGNILTETNNNNNDYIMNVYVNIN